MELQDLLNTTAGALVETTRKLDEARSSLASKEKELEGVKRQLSVVQKRAEESFAVQEKMRTYIKDQESNLDSAKRQVVAETEHIFREMRADLERAHFDLRSEVRRRSQVFEALSQILGSESARELFNRFGLKVDVSGSGSGFGASGFGNSTSGFGSSSGFGVASGSGNMSSFLHGGSSRMDGSMGGGGTLQKEDLWNGSTKLP